jgi:hypothetical protein
VLFILTSFSIYNLQFTPSCSLLARSLARSHTHNTYSTQYIFRCCCYCCFILVLPLLLLLLLLFCSHLPPTHSCFYVSNTTAAIVLYILFYFFFFFICCVACFRDLHRRSCAKEENRKNRKLNLKK